jgi:hypothetical protein
LKLAAKNNKLNHGRTGIQGFFIPLYSHWAREIGWPAAIFLANALYWQNIKGPGEWWYKRRDAKRGPDGRLLPPSSRSEQSFEWEVCLSRSAQETARAVARKHGFIEEDLKGQRLYYRVNLERVEQWSKGLSTAQNGDFQPAERQENATDLVKISHEFGEIPPPIAKNKQISFQKSRSKGLSDSSETSRQMAQHPRSGDQVGEGKTRPTNEGGILCWDDNDRARARDILSRWEPEQVALAVNRVEARGARPLPSRVHKELLKSETLSSTDQTKDYLNQYPDRTPAEIKQFTAIQQNIEKMSSEEIKSYQREYIKGEGANFSRSLNVTTGKFADVSERAAFTRWLEREVRRLA